MATSIFDVKAQVPNDVNITEALGSAKKLWDILKTHICENYKGTKDEWKFYSKKSGWTLVFKKKSRKYLETFLEDGRIPISNNLCEANIKPFATARRAWLFADTPNGARANAVLYTLVETSRANQLDVYEYLKYLLEEMPNNDHLQNPEVLNRYLPWSDELPDQCRIFTYLCL